MNAQSRGLIPAAVPALSPDVAFDVFAALGPRRSFQGTAKRLRELGYSVGDETVRTWGHRYKWWERLEQRENEVARVRAVAATLSAGEVDLRAIDSSATALNKVNSLCSALADRLVELLPNLEITRAADLAALLKVAGEVAEATARARVMLVKELPAVARMGLGNGEDPERDSAAAAGALDTVHPLAEAAAAWATAARQTGTRITMTVEGGESQSDGVNDGGGDKPGT